MELVLAASSLAGDISGSFRGLLGLTEEFCKEVFGGYEGADAFTIVPVLLRPKSRGKLSLRSRDPFQQPIIDINYYDDEDDMNTMVRGIKKVRRSLLRSTFYALHQSGRINDFYVDRIARYHRQIFNLYKIILVARTCSISNMFLIIRSRSSRFSRLHLHKKKQKIKNEKRFRN